MTITGIVSLRNKREDSASPLARGADRRSEEYRAKNQQHYPDPFGLPF